MKASYIVLEAHFEDYKSIEYVMEHWKVSPVNISQCYEKGYVGNPVYMFIGRELDLVKYLVHGYQVNDIEELKSYLMDIKSIEI